MHSSIGRITGTFIDEITWDIGSQNWSFDDWRRDFEAMSFIGIDTLIIIRGGLRDLAVFPSEVVGNAGDPDLAQLFLDEAEKHGMRLLFGTYDSGTLDGKNSQSLENEISTNVRFVDEVYQRYAGHSAFGGWYIAHEVCREEQGINHLFRSVAGHLKEKSPNLPIMISPFYPGTLIFGKDRLSQDDFYESWRKLLDGTAGLIDIVAFQDGTTVITEFSDYLTTAKRFTDEFGIEFWDNVETFDRGLSYHFPPRDIRVLRRRLELAENYVSKHITFEFSHFMSPNSSFPGAANLYRRYCETVLGVKSPF